MGLTHDRIPETAPPASEQELAAPAPARPNLGAAAYPVASGDGEAAACAVLSVDPLAGYYYEALVQDPVVHTREALFTGYLHDYPSFQRMLGLVVQAGQAELERTGDPGRRGQLVGLRAGLAIGQLALRREATPFELDILLGALEPTTAPRTAAFITEVYGEAAPGLAAQLRERAADAEQRERAHALFGLLGLREEPKDERSWWDRGVDWVADGAGELTDWSVDGLSGVPALGAMAAGLAPVAKFGQGFTAGVAKGGGAMVGGLVDLSLHPLDAAMGMATMAEHVPMSPFKGLHKLYDVAAGNRSLEDTFLRNPLEAQQEELREDGDFWRGVGGAVFEPIQRAMEEGKNGEALGRGVFDLGTIVLGLGDLKGLAQGARLAEARGLGGVADDLARIEAKSGKDLVQSTKMPREGAKATVKESKEEVLRRRTKPVDKTGGMTADEARRLGGGLPPTTLAKLGDLLSPDALAALARGTDTKALARIAVQLDAESLAALLGSGLDGHAIRELVEGVPVSQLKELARTASADQLIELSGALAKSRLSDATAELRALFLKGKPAPAGGNAAAAELTLDDGTRLTSKATSKAQPMEQPHTASMGPDPSTGRGGYYEPTAHADEGWVRLYDSEYKILSDLTDQLRAAGMKDPSGTLRLYTERAPCDSCASILREFQSRYPHVRIEVYNDFTVEGLPL